MARGGITIGAAARAGAGLALSALIAALAFALDRATGFPMMIAAMGAGLAIGSLAPPQALCSITEFTARRVLQIGVCLIGARITFDDIAALGPAPAVLAVGLVAATFLGGRALALRLGATREQATLSAGAVAVCGASATLAIAATLPRAATNERDAAAVVAAITLVGLVGMVVFPLAAHALGVPERTIAVFLGASLHEVAHVAGAGFALGAGAAAVAMMVKLIRVACLAPLILALTYARRRREGERAGLFLPPWFLIGFLALSGLVSVGVIGPGAQEALGEASRWALTMAMAAIGLRTNVRDLAGAGARLFGVVVAQSGLIVVLAALVAWAATAATAAR